jgi:hypothetical protein
VWHKREPEITENVEEMKGEKAEEKSNNHPGRRIRTRSD